MEEKKGLRKVHTTLPLIIGTKGHGAHIPCRWCKRSKKDGNESLLDPYDEYKEGRTNIQVGNTGGDGWYKIV